MAKAIHRMRNLFGAYCSKGTRANQITIMVGSMATGIQAHHGHKQEAKTANWKWLESFQTPVCPRENTSSSKVTPFNLLQTDTK